jgi:WD40 repeat protein
LSDNQTIVSVEANSIKWFNLETGEEISNYVSMLDSPNDVILSTDAQSLYVLGVLGEGIGVTKIDLDENGFPSQESFIYEQLGVPNWGLGPDLGEISVSPDGQYLSLVTEYQGFALINLETHRREYYFLEHMEYVRSARMSPDSHYLAVGNGKANLHVWNLETEQVEAAIFGDVGNAEGVIFDEDNFYALEVNYSGEGIGLWDIRENTLLAQFTIDWHDFETFTLNAEHLIAAAVSADNTVRLWQLDIEQKSLSEIAEFDSTCSEGFHRLAISMDATRLSDARGNCILVWDIPSRTLIDQLNNGYIASLSDEGQILLYGDGYGGLGIRDIERQETLCIGENFANGVGMGNRDAFWGLALNSQNTLAAGVLRFGTADLINISGCNQLSELDGSGSAIAFSQDNRFLLVGTNDGYVNLYGVRDESQP